MTQQFEAPVSVTSDGRVTVIEGDQLFVGRSRANGSSFDHSSVSDALAAPHETVDPSSSIPTGPFASVVVGDIGSAGAISVSNLEGVITTAIGAGSATFGTGREAGRLMVRGANNGPVILIDGLKGVISLLDARLRTTLILDAVSGDITFSGADCSEEFDSAEHAPPGAVMCIQDDGSLSRCETAYDTRVAGIVSGAGQWRPAMKLGALGRGSPGTAIALVGRVECMAEADDEPIEVGHLLTTSSIVGHARRASDHTRSPGAVLGKSLGTLSQGRGLIPILVSLQ
jgi:hypothetical protein